MEKFFDQEYCDRCHGELVARTMSWFNEETICSECGMWEEKIIDKKDKSKSELEGIGYVPDVEFEVRWGEPVE